MATQELPPKPTGTLSDDAQRKLWFEYLAKLNDRQLQSARASGFTPWALAAVAGAIIYRSVPQIPQFLSIPGILPAAAVVFLFEIDAVSYLGCAVLGLHNYCAIGVQARLKTELSRRPSQVTLWAAWPIGTALAVGHFACMRAVPGGSLVRWLLFGFGAWWAMNLVSGIRTQVKNTLRARKYKFPPPAFNVSILRPDWTSIALAFLTAPIGIVAVVALVVFTRSLSHEGTAWVVPLSAATQVLALIVILFSLFFLGLSNLSSRVYLDLERDIVLQNLSPSEIKARFIRDALGPSVGDWLKGLNEKFRQAASNIIAATESLKPRLKEIEKIDGQFQIERSGRARKALEDLDKDASAYFDEINRVLFQLRHLTETSSSTWETAMLSRILEEWQAETKRLKEVVTQETETFRRLQALADQAN